MSYTVDWQNRALDRFKKLPRDAQRRIDPAVLALADDPRPRASLKLSGAHGLYRLRVGEYRVVYGIDDSRQLVAIFDVFRRKGGTDY